MKAAKLKEDIFILLSRKIPKNSETIPRKSYPDLSRPETVVFGSIPSRSQLKSKYPSRRALADSVYTMTRSYIPMGAHQNSCKS
jgi:hypothetical protein